MSKNTGFTLIEIMVSLALFAVVAVVAIGAFLKIVDANRRAEAIESAVNDTNFALESMVRDLRVGTDYQCLPNAASVPAAILSPSITTCSSLTPNMMIAFNSSQTTVQSGVTCHLIHAYELSANSIQKAEQTACGGGAPFNPVTSTSSNLVINNFLLMVTGPTISDSEIQPKVFILLNGTAGVSQEDQTSFTLQTTASQRIMQ